MSGDYCPRCQSWGNVHDPDLHGVPACCKPGRHRYRRVNLAAVVYADGSSITPYHEACARCGKVKRGSFDFR